MAIEINWAGSKDAGELWELDKEAHEENQFWKLQSKSQFLKIIKKSKYLTLVGRRNGKIVAYLQSGLRNSKTHVWVENIFVLKEFRRTGIAKSLMNKFLSQWRNNVDYIVLLTADEKVDIFKKMGFEKEMNYMGYKHSRGKST